MTKFQTKLTTAFATGAVLLNALAPLASADTNLTITGNGSNSTSTAAVSSTTTNTVVQANDANISNNVHVDSNTGGNSADNNTGGNVGVQSGNATTDVSVSNAANSNAATLNNCNCNNDATVTVTGNGTGSDNSVALNNSNSTTLFQTNVANVDNHVDVDAHTGHNSADNNTGGNVTLRSGDANTSVALSTAANANSATFGGNGAGSANHGTVNALISGNGSFSDNAIALDMGNDVLLTQANVADITNDVDVDAHTGGNSADDNTGGNVALRSGNANADVTVDNLVNFNGADLDNCACLTDLNAKIAGNGTESENAIAFGGDNALTAFQTNDSNLDNTADVTGKTGYNSSDANTGSVFGNDPALLSGNSNSTFELSNAGNQNTLGQSSLTSVLHNFDFSWNWAALMGMFMSH